MSSVFEDEESKKIDKKFFTKRQNSFDWDDTVMSTVEKKSQSSQLQTNVPPLGLITQRLFYDLAPVPTPQMRNYARKCSSNLCAPRTPDDDPPTETNLQPDSHNIINNVMITKWLRRSSKQTNKLLVKANQKTITQSHEIQKFIFPDVKNFKNDQNKKISPSEMLPMERAKSVCTGIGDQNTNRGLLWSSYGVPKSPVDQDRNSLTEFLKNGGKFNSRKQLWNCGSLKKRSYLKKVNSKKENKVINQRSIEVNEARSTVASCSSGNMSKVMKKNWNSALDRLKIE